MFLTDIRVFYVKFISFKDRSVAGTFFKNSMRNKISYLRKGFGGISTLNNEKASFSSYF